MKTDLEGRLKNDLTEAIIVGREYGFNSPEIERYMIQSSNNYKNKDERQEYLELAAGLFLILKD